MSDSKHAIRVTLTHDDDTGQPLVRYVGPYDTGDDATEVLDRWRTLQDQLDEDVDFTIVGYDPGKPHRDPNPPLDPEELALTIPDRPIGFPDPLDILTVNHGHQMATEAHGQAQRILAEFADDTDAADRALAARLLPVGAAAALTRQLADTAAEDDEGTDSLEYRLYRAMADVLTVTLEHAGRLPEPLLAHLVTLAEVVHEGETQNAEVDNCEGEGVA